MEPGHFCACHLYNDAAADQRAAEAMEAAKREGAAPEKEEEAL